MDDYQKYIALSRYARWDDGKQRRESWDEIVDRFGDYLKNYVQNITNHEGLLEDLDEAIEDIRDLKVMPSMRALMTAGPALDRSNVAGYNCAYLPIDNVVAFDEAMFILMNGTGVGFSVEKSNVDRLPNLPKDCYIYDKKIPVEDSKEGWCLAIREIIADAYKGCLRSLDTSSVRPAGARLKTFGGRASGPKPLQELAVFITSTFSGAISNKQEKLTPLQCHDIVCKIAEIVVVGGVRRSALISLSDLEDEEMANAKSGNWWEHSPHRALANNSAVYTKKPTSEVFLDEWHKIWKSKSGERGFFNREAVTKQVSLSGRRDLGYEWGTNPCCEIILRPYQFCNLTEVVVRTHDTEEELMRKVRSATLLGTIQAMWTNFTYLRDVWKENCEEERLLGVSLTGVYDGSNVFETSLLRKMREYSVLLNQHYSKKLQINSSAAITCIKPSGTVSQLVNSGSGLHPRHSQYYIRTVRGDNKDPMTQFLKDQGVPNEPCVMQPDSTTVFSFYIKSPEGAAFRNDLDVTEHFEDWLYFQKEWCEHKPSVTLSVKTNDWMSLGAMIFNNFDEMTGVSILPYDGHVYAQAPYQEITKEEYDNSPVFKIDWGKLPDYEKEDHTTGSQELACTGSQCEIVDIT